MKSKELIIKLIASLVCIAVMSVIILFVFNYYSDKALHGDNTTDNNTINETDNSNETNNNSNTNSNEITFKEFNNIKTYLDGFDSKVIMRYEETDAGNILFINDNIVTSYTAKDTVTYGILKDAIVVRISNDYDGDILVFSDENGNVFREFSLVNNNTYNLYIKKSIMSNFSDAIVFKGNSFTITWRVNQDAGKNIILGNDEILEVNNNMFADKVYRKGDIVEYTIESEYLGDKKFTEATKIEEYNLEDYIKKFK